MHTIWKEKYILVVQYFNPKVKNPYLLFNLSSSLSLSLSNPHCKIQPSTIPFFSARQLAMHCKSLPPQSLAIRDALQISFFFGDKPCHKSKPHRTQYLIQKETRFTQTVEPPRNQTSNYSQNPPSPLPKPFNPPSSVKPNHHQRRNPKWAPIVLDCPYQHYKVLPHTNIMRFLILEDP